MHRSTGSGGGVGPQTNSVLQLKAYAHCAVQLRQPNLLQKPLAHNPPPPNISAGSTPGILDNLYKTYNLYNSTYYIQNDLS